MLVKRKNWDSDFFGYEVYEMYSENISRQELKKEIEIAKEQGARLVYLFSKEEIDTAESCGGKLVDKKVVYSKPVRPYTDEQYITSFPKENDYKVLLPLSLESGKYSRFKLDGNFVRNEFERLYEEWIKQSVCRKIANEVLVYHENKEIQGMVTVAVKDEIASIGLIAVSDQYRGKKIGSMLLGAVFNYANSHYCAVLNVPTQKHNIRACNFYEKNDFQISTIENVYHFWI